MALTVDLKTFEKQLRAVERQTGEVAAITGNRVLQQVLKDSVEPARKMMRKTVPKPGYPGDKPGKPPLRRTIATKIKQGKTWYAVVGPKWPAGAHGYNVEWGHRIAGTSRMTRAVLYAQKAIKATTRQVFENLESRVGNMVDKAWSKRT